MPGRDLARIAEAERRHKLALADLEERRREVERAREAMEADPTSTDARARHKEASRRVLTAQSDLAEAEANVARARKGPSSWQREP